MLLIGSALVPHSAILLHEFVRVTCSKLTQRALEGKVAIGAVAFMCSNVQ